MAGRGPQTFKKRQKEQQRKEKQQEKAAKRLQRKDGDKESGVVEEDDLTGLGLVPDFDLDRRLPDEADAVEAP